MDWKKRWTEMGRGSEKRYGPKDVETGMRAGVTRDRWGEAPSR